MSNGNINYPVKRLYNAKYQTQQDILAIAAIGLAHLDQNTADYYRKVIKGKMQEFWMEIGNVLMEAGLAVPCGCEEHSHCEECIGKRFVDIDD